MGPHRFGGEWTDEKLARVAKYLSAYTTIFRRNERARHLRTIYIDAFAGTGRRDVRGDDADPEPLFSDIESDEEAERFKKGSASIALEVSPGFDRYIFVEADASRVAELTSVVDRYPAK